MSGQNNPGSEKQDLGIRNEVEGSDRIKKAIQELSNFLLEFFTNLRDEMEVLETITMELRTDIDRIQEQQNKKRSE